MNDSENFVQLLIDSDVLQSEYVGFHPCINTSSLRMKTKDLTDRICRLYIKADNCKIMTKAYPSL